MKDRIRIRHDILSRLSRVSARWSLLPGKSSANYVRSIWLAKKLAKEELQVELE